MASTQHADLHVDAALTAWAQEYAGQDETLIGSQLAPAIPVTKRSDKYWIHGAERFELMDTARAPGAQYGEVKWAKSTDSFFCEGHGLKARVPDEDMKNADLEVDPAKDAISIPLAQMKLAEEKAIADMAFSTTEFTQTSALAAADRWDVDTSDIVDQVDDAKATVRGTIGREPNVMAIGYDVFREMRKRSELRKIIFGLNASEALPTEAQIAEALGLEKLLVGRAVYYSAANTFTNIWGKYAFIGHIAPSPTARSLAPLKSFGWTGEGPRYATRGPVWDDDTKSWKWYVDDYRDLKKTSLYAAYLYSTVVS